MAKKQIRPYVDPDVWENLKQDGEKDTDAFARILRDYDKMIAILCVIDSDPLVALGQLKQLYEQSTANAQAVAPTAQPVPPVAPAPVPTQPPPPPAPAPKPQAQTTELTINMPAADEFDDAENF